MMWQVIETMYEASRSVVSLEGEVRYFLEQGVVQGCSLSPIILLFYDLRVAIMVSILAAYFLQMTL